VASFLKLCRKLSNSLLKMSAHFPHKMLSTRYLAKTFVSL